jgi:outer membrane receptor protein involved in Fe transport
MDTSEIGFRHVNFKTGQGKIQFSPRYLPPVAPITAAELPVQKTTLAPRQELLYQLGADVTMLDEIYVTASPLQVSEAPANALGRADYKIDTKKLLRGSSTNLVEALVANIPGLMTYRSQDGFTFFFAEAQNFKEVATPLIILDGYQFTGDGVAWLSQINPATVKSVEVVRFGGASMFGLRAAGGVIIIETFKGELDNTKSEFVTFDKGFFEKVRAIGYTSAALAPFKSRDYRNPEQTGVDYRSTIYWNPNIQPDEQGVANVEFFAADEETNYQLLVEGVTEKGMPLRTTLKIPIVR